MSDTSGAAAPYPYPDPAATPPDYGSAIASIESAGSKTPYQLRGPVTNSGDQALGRYQVMTSNVGPWSQEILGQSITPDQFLQSPALQDQIFNGKFGQYVDKYGPQGAAQAWFAGPGGMNKPGATDQLGTSVSTYGKKFMSALADQQGAPPPPAPPPALAPPARPVGVPAPSGAPYLPPASTPPQAPQQAPQQQDFTPQVPQLSAPGALPIPRSAPPNFARLAALLQNAPPSVRRLISKG